MRAFSAFMMGPMTAVVNIKTEEEFNSFVETCEKRGLDVEIESIKRYGFANCHKNGGVQVIPYGELCFEYLPYKGFTFGKKEDYILFSDYGERSIISCKDFVKNITLSF